MPVYLPALYAMDENAFPGLCHCCSRHCWVIGWFWLMRFIIGTYHLIKNNLPAITLANWLFISQRLQHKIPVVVPSFPFWYTCFRVSGGCNKLPALFCPAVSVADCGYLSAHGFISIGRLQDNHNHFLFQVLYWMSCCCWLQGVCAIVYTDPLYQWIIIGAALINVLFVICWTWVGFG